MQIKVAKQDLEAALNVVNVGVSGADDIQGHFVFRTDGPRLTVYSYNGRLGTASPVRADVTADVTSEAFTIKAKKFNQWLRASTAEEITIDYQDATVRVRGQKGTVTFRSLDPSTFPFWDKVFEQSMRTATVPAGRLQDAITHTKGFILSKDTEMPQYALTEVDQSAFWATDQYALSVVTVQGLAKCGLRVHGKDLSTLGSFLSLSDKEDEVEIHEQTRSTFFVRKDGSVLSISKPTTPFVELTDVNQDGDADYWWEFSGKTLRAAIQQISAGAADDDTLLTMSHNSEEGVLNLSMKSEAGDLDTLSIECAAGESGKAEHPLPEHGWSADYNYLLKILASYKESDTIRFGLFPMGDAGITRIREMRDGDKYVTMVIWG